MATQYFGFKHQHGEEETIVQIPATAKADYFDMLVDLIQGFKQEAGLSARRRAEQFVALPDGVGQSHPIPDGAAVTLPDSVTRSGGNP